MSSQSQSQSQSQQQQQQQFPSQMPFWDFIPFLDPTARGPPTGGGVDHADVARHPPPPPPPFHGSFPFRVPGPHHHHPPHHPSHFHHQGPTGHDAAEWGPRGPRGRRSQESSVEQDDDEVCMTPPYDELEGTQEKDASPDTVRADVPDPVESAPDDGDFPPRCRHPNGFGRSRRSGGRSGRGEFRPGGRHSWNRGPPTRHPFGWIHDWPNNPFIQPFFSQATGQDSHNNNANSNDDSNDDSNTFTPPIDIFNTPIAFILHVALPGANKEDIGINWDADRHVLSIAGVVHRPGDEALLQTLTTTCERRVGVFEREVTLPLKGSSEREEVDGMAISAKMDNGVLIVTVPKLEKEWTHVHKVDIE